MMLQAEYEKYDESWNKETAASKEAQRRLIEGIFESAHEEVAQYTNRKLQQCRFNPSELKNGCISGGCSGTWPYAPIVLGIGGKVDIKGEFCTNTLELVRDSKGDIKDAIISSPRGRTTAPLDTTSLLFKALTGQK